MQTLHEVLKITHGGNIPFVLAGDFNDTGDALVKSGWLQDARATIVGPSEGTCTSTSLVSPQGRCIDFLVVSDVLRPLICAVHTDWQVPFGPHCGIRLCIARDSSLIKELKAIKPRVLPTTFRTNQLSVQDI